MVWECGSGGGELGKREEHATGCTLVTERKNKQRTEKWEEMALRPCQLLLFLYLRLSYDEILSRDEYYYFLQ